MKRQREEQRHRQGRRNNAPEEISTLVLRKLADGAAKFLGERVTEAVITIPAYINDSQRQATKDAGKIALGGGRFDVSLLDVGDGVVEVRATSGDGHLGGDDFDKRVVDYLADEFKRDQGIDLRNYPQELQRLYEVAERAKEVVDAEFTRE